jgi:methylsterol monooxygenase
MTQGRAAEPSSTSKVTGDHAVGRKQRRLFNSIKTAIFVIGTAAIVLIAFRNTVTWHLQRFWGASGDLWQLLWDRIFDLFGGDPRSMGTTGTSIVTIGSYWIYNLLFIIFDLGFGPQWVKRYKVQDTEKLDPKRMLKALPRILFNQLVMGTLMIVIGYQLSKWRGCSFERELPTFNRVIVELLICVVVEELLFYYSHRLLHHPRIYKHVHKIHHEWTAPIGIVSVYAHPLEHVISNMVPLLVGPLLCGSHIATTWLWYTLALFSTTIHHCGYHFPLLPSPEFHDFHHLKFTQNYGVLGVLDRFHGTDNQFRSSKAYDRHFLALSLVPVKELYPDDTKKNK